MAFDFGGYLKGEQGLFPDWDGESTTQSIKNMTGAGENEGWLPGDQSEVTRHIPGFQTGDKKGYDDVLTHPISTMFNWMSGEDKEAAVPGTKAQEPAAAPQEPAKDMNWWRQNLDPSNNEQVKELQQFLGIKDDGMFGPQTQNAWRNAVEGHGQASNKARDFLSKAPMVGQFVPEERHESLKYNYNPEMLRNRLNSEGFSGTKLGGMLSKGWTGLDKKLGGILPGGYRKDAENMTQKEYEMDGYKGD